MSIGPDVLAQLGGGDPAAAQHPPYVQIGGGDPGAASGEPQDSAGVVDEIRSALDAVQRAFQKDGDEEDKAKYLQIAKLLQDCLAKNQADVHDALGGSGALARLTRKAGQ